MKLYVFDSDNKPAIFSRNAKELANHIRLYYSNRHKPDGAVYKEGLEKSLGMGIGDETVAVSVTGFAKGSGSHPILEMRIVSFASNINRAPRYLVYRLVPGSKGQLLDSEGCLMTPQGFRFLWGRKIDQQYFVKILLYVDRTYSNKTRYQSILSWAWEGKTAPQVIDMICA